MDKPTDKYCWKCCGVKTTLKCSTCSRSFHDTCEYCESDQCSQNDWRCSVCIKLEASKNTEEELQRIPFIFNKIYNTRYFNVCREYKTGAKKMKLIKGLENTGEKIVHAIDLKDIKTKVAANKYISLYEFLIDFEWIVHNHIVLYKGYHENTKRAKKLLNFVSDEIDFIETCVQCHINANTKETQSRWFIMVHDVPHLVIWAKRKNSKYWPAKVMSFDDQNVYVALFGSHKSAYTFVNVPINKCYLYSKESPTNKQLKSNDAKFQSAVEEANQYTECIRNKFGNFQFAPTKIKFNPAAHGTYIRNLVSANEIFSEEREAAQRDENIESDSDDSTNDESMIGNRFAPLTPRLVDHSYESSDMFGESSTGQNGSEENDTDEDMQDEVYYETETSNDDDDDDMFSMNDLNSSLQQFTKHVTNGFDRTWKRYEKLKNRFIDSEKQVKKSEETNTCLMNENVQLKIKMENQIDTHNREMDRMKEEHQQQIKQQKLVMDRKEEEHNQQIEQQKLMMDRMKEEHQHQIEQQKLAMEDAKNNKYCLSCDTPKRLDIYNCSMECQKRYWERSFN